MFRSIQCYSVVVRVSLIALGFVCCASGLKRVNNLVRSKAGTFNDCEDVVENQPAAGPIIKKFDDNEVTIGGVHATQLKCIGGGDHGVAFSGIVNGEKVIVKMTHKHHLIMVRHHADKMTNLFFQEVSHNADATGAQSFTPQISEGFVDVPELPRVWGQIWKSGVGQNWMQIQDDGGFKNGEDFMDFMKKSFDAIMFMWSVGIRHGDIQRGNIMWDDKTRKVSLIDYENFQYVDPHGYNEDLHWIDDGFRRYRHHHKFEKLGKPVVAMVNDFLEHKKYRDSLDNFMEFYKKHFHDEPTLPKKQRDSDPPVPPH